MSKKSQYKEKSKNKINIRITFIALVLLSITLVSAQEKTIEVNLLIEGLEPFHDVELYEGYPIYYTVFTDHRVSLYSISVNDYNEIEESNEGSFRAELLSTGGILIHKINFEPSFLILSEPPTETDTELITLSFPYSDNAKTLKVYWNEQEKLSVGIKDTLCNYNSQCTEN